MKYSKCYFVVYRFHVQSTHSPFEMKNYMENHPSPGKSKQTQDKGKGHRRNQIPG